MANPTRRVETADAEAAAWHARLGERSVSTETLNTFFDWRKTPENADAYRRVELAWGETRKLAGDPEIQAALTDALGRKAQPAPAPRKRRLVMGFLAVSAAAVLVVGGWVQWQARTVFSTAVGEQRVVQLDDGSSIRLNTDSRIRVRFDDDRRRVALETGQAIFTVAHDVGRPFVVTAGDAQVTAVGTMFDVRRLGNGASVTLINGVVDLAGGDRTERMTAGHAATVTSGGATPRPVDVASETSWAEGRIVFRDTPLGQAVDEVNRYLTAKVDLDADVLASEPVNGVFKTGDRDAFVSTASEVFDLQVSAGANGSVRLSEREK